ncbi:MAG: DUF2490 domain-containing protein [Saprospiraceae bacterium]
MRAKLIILICLIQFFKATSQESIEDKSEVWLGVITEMELGKFSIWNDAHLVPGDFTIVRTGLTYKFAIKKWQPKLTLGYAHLWLHSNNPQINFIHENRPWGQLVWSNNFGNQSILQRIRFDSRFKKIVDPNDLEQYTISNNYRLRYLLQYKYYLKSKQASTRPFLATSSEALVNFGTNIKDNVRIDQLRFLLAAGIKKHNSTIQLGYLNRIKLDAKNDSKIMYHTLMVLYFQTIDFKNQHKK